MGRLSWRWGVVAAVVTVLACLPALAGVVLPVGSTDLTAAQLRDLVRDSDTVPWEGLGESRVDLPLPDVDDLDDVPALLGGRTRTRTTWVGPDAWRSDRIEVASEVDTIRTDGRTLTWNSADRLVNVVFGELPVRLPIAGDLTAPTLGRRLAATPRTTLSRIDDRRVVGRTGAGIRLTPDNPDRTTVESIDLWVHPDTGLVLRVEIRTPGMRTPVLTSLMLDLDIGSADPERLRFRPPQTATVTDVQAPDIASEIDRFAPYLLPSVLAGDARTNVSGLSNGGVATYGAGVEAYAVIPVEGGLARRLRRAADAAGTITTPLVNALIGEDGRRTYLLVGTVPLERLQAGLDGLRENRPPRLR